MLNHLALLIVFVLASCQFKNQEQGASLVAGHSPTTNSFSVQNPSNGIYREGQSIDFFLSFPYALTVTGTPRLTLNIGGATRFASYTSGSGTSKLLFRYIIVAGDNDNDGVSAGSSIDLNSGSLQFTGTQGLESASTSLTLASLSGVRIDTTSPTLTVSAPTAGTYFRDLPMSFTVTGSEAVVVSGTPRLTLTLDSGVVFANYVSGSGTTNLTFQFVPGATHADANGIIVQSPVDLNGGVLRDVAGNLATLAFSPPVTSSVLVDGNIPIVTAITPPTNGSYVTGNALDFVLTYSEAVDVTGIPSLGLTIGATNRTATYQTGTGSTQLTFRYIVQSDDLDIDGISGSSTLNMTGATIRDSGGTNALNLLNSPTLTGVLVNNNYPRISSFNISNGIYYIGQTLTITAIFNQAVTVSGVPRIPIALNTGGVVHANYASGSGTSTLVFAYTVTSGSDDSDGIVINSPLDLNGGTIRNANGLDANLVFTPPSTALVQVSGIRPTVTSLNPPSAGTYTTGQNLNFIINFSENVTVSNTGNLILGLTIGSNSRQATYLSGSGTNALTFRYTIVPADADTNGIGVGTLTAGAPDYITDGTATNNLATLTFTTPDTSMVLVNATTPTITSVTPPANATYLLNQNVNFIVNFSEAVTVTGTPSLSLTVGSTSRMATYVSGTGTTALTFRYTVPSNDVDTNGIATASPLLLSGGTIQSGNGVNADLNFSLPNTAAVFVDGDEPTVISTTVPAASLYTINQVSWVFTVTFDQIVTVTNTPRWVLNIGGTTRYATYTSGSGTTTLTFTHTLNAADIDLDGIAVGNGGSIDLNGSGTIRDANTNNANLSLNSPNVSGIVLTYLNMVGWWDFDFPSSVTTVACGIQQCVSAVTDKTGNNINMNQVTTTAQPKYFASGFGSGNRGYVAFNGTSEFLNLNPTTGLATMRTMIIVFRTESGTMTAQDLFDSSAGGTNARVQVTAAGGLTYGGTAQAGWSRNGSALTANATTGAPALLSSTRYILVVRFSANQSPAATQRLGNINFGGQIAEVMTFTNNALTDAQLSPIINYLNAKHGIY
jgi:hypothetical protein